MRLRPLEPGPGKVAEARTEAGVLFLEQPALLFAIAPKTAGLAAGGGLLGEHGIPRDRKEGRREFGRRMELRRRVEDGPGQFKQVRREWCLGDQAFRTELLAQMKEPRREHNFGEDRAETEQAQAEGIVREGLRRLGWQEADLEARRKGDQEKLKLAVRLRDETTVTLKWIAERLRMGTWTHLNHLLYWHRRGTSR